MSIPIYESLFDAIAPVVQPENILTFDQVREIVLRVMTKESHVIVRRECDDDIRAWIAAMQADGGVHPAQMVAYCANCEQAVLESLQLNPAKYTLTLLQEQRAYRIDRLGDPNAYVRS